MLPLVVVRQCGPRGTVLARKVFAQEYVREYSSENKDMFLSDLLSRIDRISAATQTAKQKREQNLKPQGGSQKRVPQTDKNWRPRTKPVKSEKVQVADHPLYVSKLESTKQKQTEPTRNARASIRAAPNNRNRQQRRVSRPTNMQKTPAREPRKVARRDNQQVGSNRHANNKDQQEVSLQTKSKTLAQGPFKPLINGDTFLYGKAASFGLDTRTRMASVTKELLEDSKYPYMLPRDIINLVQPGVPRNRFLLQSNFSLDIEREKLARRIREVVKGESQLLEVDEGKFKDPIALNRALFTRDQLMRNPDLNLSSKQYVFNAVNGFLSPKQILHGAHWAKQ